MQQAINKELCTLHKIDKTNTWDLAHFPPGKSVVGCRWVYKIKNNSDGYIEWYKVRLVAKRYSQQYGMDYKEIFSLIAKMTTFHTPIVIASVCQ